MWLMRDRDHVGWRESGDGKALVWGAVCVLGWHLRSNRGGLMRQALLFIDPGFDADLKDVTRIGDVELGDPGARRRR